jgi:uncharacterized protein YjiS (DUF1127 family)
MIAAVASVTAALTISRKENIMVSAVINFLDGVKNTVRYYNTIHELSRLSDRELGDLGLTRYEICLVSYRTYLDK